MNLAALIGARFAAAKTVMVGRAALGLVAVLRAWRRDRSPCRVALPGAICHEVVIAIAAAGCEPLFCDVDPASGLVAQAEWRRARVRGAEVAIVVHLYGNPASVAEARAIFPAPQCLVIDDAAQALGSHRDGVAAGGAGDVGLLSFGQTKHIALRGAAVLFRSEEFAAAVVLQLEQLAPAPPERRVALGATFRARLQEVRAHLRSDGEAASCSFRGLLDGLEPLLYVAREPRSEDAVLQQLENYAAAAQARIAKAQLWSQCLEGAGLPPVGMGMGCVPWRYVCRLPGTDWLAQERLAAALRAGGMHVSNWYLPAHWFLGHGARSLPGVERLAREVFQFWVDEHTTLESIPVQAMSVRRELSRMTQAVSR